MITSHRSVSARWAVATTLAALAGGLLAGCSSPSHEGTSSAGNDRGTALTACLREKGYDVPDPDRGGGGGRASVPEGVDPAQYERDMASCAEESAPDGAGQAEAAQEAPGSKELHREVAACLRDNGFTDYPDDPDAARNWKPSDERAFETAVATCEDAAGVPKGDRTGG